MLHCSVKTLQPKVLHKLFEAAVFFIAVSLSSRSFQVAPSMENPDTPFVIRDPAGQLVAEAKELVDGVRVLNIEDGGCQSMPVNYFYPNNHQSICSLICLFIHSSIHASLHPWNIHLLTSDYGELNYKLDLIMSFT